MDVELYLSTFADDGRFNSYQGHDQLRENFNRVISADQWPRPQHYNGQLLFLEGDSRRCRLKSYSTIIYRLGDGRVNFRHLGLCRDTCLNLGDRWVFEERLWEVWPTLHDDVLSNSS
jgi:hypothetical protein